MSENNRAWIPAVIVAALGYFVDVFDIWMFSIVRTKSLSEFGLSGDALTTAGVHLINAQLIGMMIGAVLWGVLGDKRGRLSVLIGSIMLYSLATLANGFVTSVEQYAVLRFIAGIGLAGEIGGGITLVSELIPTRYRGYATTAVATTGVSGAIAAGLVGDLMEWRSAYIVGGLAGLSLLLLRVGLRESATFTTITERKDVARGDLLLLFRSGERVRRYVACILVGVPVWYCAGVLVAFSPELSKAMQVTGPVSVGIALTCMTAAMAGMDLVSGLVSQFTQSRRTPIAVFVLCCLFLTLGFLSQRGITPYAFYVWCTAIGATLGYWAVFVTTVAEQFGTNLRAVATTTIPNFVRGSVVILTLAFEYFRHDYGILNTVEVMGMIVMLGSLAAIAYLKESFHRNLDYLEIRGDVSTTTIADDIREAA